MGLASCCKDAEMPPEISLIIPLYNGAPYLAETLAAAVGQTLAPREIVAVDDGGADASPALASAYGCHVISQAHGGIARACNTGLRHAKGEFLLFLDQDDILLPEALAALASAIGDNDGAEGLAQDFLAPDLPAAERAKIRLRSAPYSGLLSGCVLVRRAAALANGSFNEAYAAGQALDWLMRLRSGFRTVRLKQLTVMRRIHSGNTSRRLRSRQWRDYGAILRRRLEAGRA